MFTEIKKPRPRVAIALAEAQGAEPASRFTRLWWVYQLVAGRRTTGRLVKESLSCQRRDFGRFELIFK